jgi:hypothetical protein
MRTFGKGPFDEKSIDALILFVKRRPTKRFGKRSFDKSAMDRRIISSKSTFKSPCISLSLHPQDQKALYVKYRGILVTIHAPIDGLGKISLSSSLPDEVAHLISCETHCGVSVACVEGDVGLQVGDVFVTMDKHGTPFRLASIEDVEKALAATPDIKFMVLRKMPYTKVQKLVRTFNKNWLEPHPDPSYAGCARVKAVPPGHVLQVGDIFEQPDNPKAYCSIDQVCALTQILPCTLKVKSPSSLTRLMCSPGGSLKSKQVVDGDKENRPESDNLVIRVVDFSKLG